ncbi:MAG TPA: Gfo/Idh/MocA family oxidoreductase [Albitalea sp.]
MSRASTLRLDSARRFARFVSIYGPGRSLFKAAGRLRLALPSLARRAATPDIGIIGCGQFAYATIGYFLHRAFGRRIAACHDIDPRARDSLAAGLGVPRACASADELLATPGLRTVYVASNHASHAPYAAAALARGLDVVVEKPVAVSEAQLVALLRARRRSAGRLFAGYNRPFSAAVRDLREHVRIDPHGGLSLHCFVSGHRLGPDHWYRRPEEGTRVCGNLGHWLDLFVHLLAWRGLPDRLDVSATWADDAEPDDNLCVTIRSDRADLFSVMLTSRCEPYEGINETIHFQHADTICKIDDFRRLALWQGARLVRRRYWPKDVGHRLAVMQPFAPGPGRDWHEVELSTLLMLRVARMVVAREREARFSFRDDWARISEDIERE